jgi:4-oxalmesaconate hydratase
VFEDFPTLKLISAHGGGPVPYQIGRWRANRWRSGREVKETFDESLGKLFFDTVLYNKESIELLLKICGADHCMFGTEKPGFGSARDPQSGLWLDDLKPVIESIEWLSEADRELVFEGTARRVFTKLKVAA